MIQYQTGGLTVFESALFRTTTTVYHNADLVLLVDPNWLPEEVAAIRQYVDSIRQNQDIYLLFTHSDYDHIIAYGAFPEAKTIASQAFVNNPKQQDILRQIREFDESYYIQRAYPLRYPKIDFVVEKDGQQLRIGESTLSFYLAPGHNSDGIFTIIQPEGIWLVGDYLSNIEFPFVYHSFSDYHSTIGKVPTMLDQHPFRLLIPGHGAITDSRQEVLHRRQESLDYLQNLETSVQEGSPFDLDALWKRYDFPAGMLPFHEGNVALMKSELGKEEKQ